MKTLIARFAADEEAALATEYGLLAAGIGVAILSVVGQVGTHLGNLLDRVVAELKGE
jgi:pilus assembly protein Flp/PilA